MKTFRKILLASLLTSATSLLADPAEPADGATRPAFRYGGDIRLRQELWDDIPLPTEEPIVTRNGFNNTYRLRTRAFAAYDFTDWATVNIRLTHMFYKTIAGPESFKWPDELSPDNVNFEFRDLTGEGSKLVVGRQDIFLGSGRLVFEGTPLDAARTTFFDGILLHQPTSDEFHSVDIFAVYNKDEDPLAIGHVHRQLRGYSPAVDGRDEAGVGIFANTVDPDGDWAASVYFIWKHETGAFAADGSHVENDDIFTFGFLGNMRVDRFTFEMELAFQADQEEFHHDLRHYWDWDPGWDGLQGLAFAGIKYDAIEREGKKESPLVFGLDCLYLSADDPDTQYDEAFNPVFSRYPFLSELMIYDYDTEGAGNWNNLIHPRLTLSAKMAGHTLALSAGPVFAQKRNGAGGGHRRGDLYTAQYTFPLFSGIGNGRGKTSGCLLAEVLDPGDYYLSDHTAYFFRWQIVVAF